MEQAVIYKVRGGRPSLIPLSEVDEWKVRGFTDDVRQVKRLNKELVARCLRAMIKTEKQAALEVRFAAPWREILHRLYRRIEFGMKIYEVKREPREKIRRKRLWILYKEALKTGLVRQGRTMFSPEIEDWQPPANYGARDDGSKEENACLGAVPDAEGYLRGRVPSIHGERLARPPQ